MLVKKELIALPIGTLTYKNRDGYSAAANTYVLPRSGAILAVDIFESGKGRPLFARFYTDGKKHIFYMAQAHDDLMAGDWTERKVFEVGYWGSSKEIRATEKDTDTVKNFLRKNSDYSVPSYKEEMGRILGGFIWHLGYEQRNKKWDREIALWKKCFGMYPDYPKDLPRYCEDHVFRTSTAFYGKKETGQRKAKCCHCGKQFTAPDGVRARDAGICPKCGKPIVFRQGWNTGTVKSKAKICIAYKVNDQLLLRYATVIRQVSPDHPKPSFDFDDFFLDLFLTKDALRGKPTEYSYWYGNGGYGPACWHRLRNDNSGCHHYTYLYTGNLQEVFGDKLYTVDTDLVIDQLDELRRPIHVRRLLDNLKNYPQAEYLLKMGLPQLADGYIDKDKRGFEDVVGVSRQYLPILRETQANHREIGVLAAYPRWVEPDTIRRLVNLNLDYSDFGTLREITEDVPLGRTLRYLEKQQQLPGQRQMTFSHLMEIYKDYIAMAKLLGADMRIKSLQMPPRLKERHDQLVHQANKKRCELEDAAMRKVIEDGLYWWAQDFGNKDFTVVYPQGKSDFIREGQCLNHCVGSSPSYFENHCKGTRMIFFIRRAAEPDKPFFTAEIDMVDHHIRQLYGFRDCSAPTEVRDFTKEFARACARWMSSKSILGVSA